MDKNIEQNNKLIEQNNKLIKEFMEEQYIGVRYKDYDTSWDCLMPVVGEIRKLMSHKIETNDNDDDILSNLYLQILHGLNIVDIKLVWKSVIEFIKWYNKVKEE